MDNKNKIIGFTAGSFDLGPHCGHDLMFEESKAQCDYLIVALQSDPTLDRPDTKNKPIQGLFERFIQLRSNKFIDEIIVYETEADLYILLSSLKIDKRFIGADWYEKAFTGYDIPGMLDKTIYNSRNHGYSTSNLRERVTKAENDKLI
jgi:glycerol-3-phosphate cytidylyltransferase